MVNFKFMLSQLKQVWVIVAWFTLAGILLILADVIGRKSLSMLNYIHGSGSGSSIQGIMGSGSEMFTAITITGTMTLSFIIGILLVYKLFVREINRGYISNWLTLPMSRTNITVTKLLTIVSAIGCFHIISFSLQEILFASLLLDFTKQAAVNLFALNITMFVTALLFLGITWLMVTIINKHVIALAIAATLATIFVVFYLLANINPEPANPFHVLRYMTLLIFVDNPFRFDENNPITVWLNPQHTESYQYYPLIFTEKNFLWQIPAPLLVSLPLFISGAILFRHKNLSI